MRNKGELSIREVLQKRDNNLWEKLEAVWKKALPIHEAIEKAKGEASAKSHSLAVEENISALIPDNRKSDEYKTIELFALSVASCLHDMDKGLDAFKTLHGEVSAGEIGLHPEDYGLDRGQADIVRWIIRVHDHGDFIDDLPYEPLSIGAIEVDVRCLAAIFKLADILHADYRRVEKANPSDSKERARICIRGWIYDDKGEIRFQAVPDEIPDIEHIDRAIAMMQKDIEPIATILRQFDYPYELATPNIDDSKIKYKIKAEDEKRKKSDRSFIGLDSFSEDDEHIFKGRKEESEELYRLMLTDDPIISLIGDSGVGKTSLIRAGLFPLVKKAGWKFTYTRPLTNPLADIIRGIEPKIDNAISSNEENLVSVFEYISKQNKGKLLIVMDQFEDVFRFPGSAEKLAEAMFPVQAKRFRNLRVLLSYRADAEGQVGPMLEKIALSSKSIRRSYLKALEREGAKEALETGFDVAQIGLDPKFGSGNLMNMILDGIEAQGRGFYPPYIQMVGETLKDNAVAGVVMKSLYDSLGHAESIIGNYLFNQLGSFGGKQKDVEQILIELISVAGPEGKKAQTKSIDELSLRLGINYNDVRELLHGMGKKWMVRHIGEEQYEIIHDQLAKLVDEKLIKTIEEREFRQFREHLTTAAATYKSTNILLEPIVMAKLYQNREKINPSLIEKEILLHSCLAENGPAWYWFRNSLEECSTMILSGLSHPKTCLNAVKALGYIGDEKAIPQLREMLRNEDSDVRRAAAEAFGNLGGKKAIPQLLEMLKDKSWDVERAAEAFGRVATHEDIPQLREMLKDEDCVVRRLAAEALGNLGAKEAIPQLLKMLKDRYWGDQRVAAEALGNLGAKEAIPQLRQMLKDEDWLVWEAAAEALGNLGDKKAIPQLLEMLKDGDWDVRRAAAEALGNLGAKEAIPQLLKMLKDRYWGDQRVAAEALKRMTAHEDIPQLQEMLKYEDRNVKRALEAWGIFGSKEVIPQLREMPKDEDGDVRKATVLGIVATHEYIPQLREMLKDEDRDVRRAVVAALGRMATHEDIPQLREMLKDEDRNVWIAAAEAEALEYIDSEESVLLWLDLLDVTISKNKNISIIKDKLVLADRKLYCPFNWPDKENQ